MRKVLTRKTLATAARNFHEALLKVPLVFCGREEAKFYFLNTLSPSDKQVLLKSASGPNRTVPQDSGPRFVVLNVQAIRDKTKRLASLAPD